MSRSNPTLDNTPHPCQRWFEWDGDSGVLKYYDKEKKENIRLEKPDFGFILLDQTSSIRGYNDKKKISFRSNEIRDTGKDVLTVKSSDSLLVAQGIYSQIRDRIVAAGASFRVNLYMAFKNGAGALSLGCIQLKGSSLNSWIEFSKKNRPQLYKQAIKITGHSEHKTGKIVYRTPVFALGPVSEETNNQAIEVDQFLQEYFQSYFARKTTQQVDAPPPAEPEQENESESPQAPDPEDDVPF